MFVSSAIMLTALGCVCVAIALIQALFGVLLLVYLPNLDPYPGYTPIRSDSINDSAYEELAGGEQICPERHVNIISRMYFSF